MNVWTSLIPLTPRPNLELIELCGNWIPVHRVILLIHKIQSTIQVTFSFRFAILIYNVFTNVILCTYAYQCFQKKRKCAIFCKIQCDDIYNASPSFIWFIALIFKKDTEITSSVFTIHYLFSNLWSSTYYKMSAKVRYKRCNLNQNNWY